MPLPKPKPNQEKDKFISSCMASDVMNKEFPNNSQRYAICQSQWKRAKKAKANWQDFEQQLKNIDYIVY